MKISYWWILLILVLVLLSACSNSETKDDQITITPNEESTPIPSAVPEPEVNEKGLTATQQEAYDQISAAAGFEPELLVDLGIPRFIAPYLPSSSDDPESAARDFFESYAGLFGVENLDDALQPSRSVLAESLDFPSSPGLPWHTPATRPVRRRLRTQRLTDSQLWPWP